MYRFIRAGALGLALVLGVLVGGSANAAVVHVMSAAQLTSDAQTTAIQQVIQQSNAEQARALASGDQSVMADTATADHLQQLQQINSDLTSGGVAAIQLSRLEWGPISVNGNTATATTYETWTIQFRDGTTQTSRDTNVYTLVKDNSGWKIQSDEHPGTTPSGAPAPAPAASAPGATSPAPASSNPAPAQRNPFSQPSRDTSHNWSGYATTDGKFTSVNGTWTVPQIQPTGAAGVGATWVGIGGVTSTDLIQAGTQETDMGSGRVQYSAWIEMLPRASQQIPFTVHPGDSVTVNIAEQSPSNWQIDFKNNSTGQTYQRSVRYQSSHSSAEWVVEAPSEGYSGGILPLDNFGTIPFSAASATENGQTVDLNQSHAQPISMLGGTGQTLAVPSSISSDGSGFSVSRTTAPASAPARGRTGSSRGVSPFPNTVPPMVIPFGG
jgi:hypothetical protein